MTDHQQKAVDTFLRQPPVADMAAKKRVDATAYPAGVATTAAIGEHDAGLQQIAALGPQR